MDFKTAIRTCLQEKYARFSGRASRSEYWWFILAYVIGAILVSLTGIGVLYMLYVLALIVPLAAAGFRRLQDTGRPGWTILIPIGLAVLGTLLRPARPVVEGGRLMQMPDLGSMGMLAVLGLVQLVLAVVFLYWLTRPTQPETNEYGPPPSA